eukprot:GEMP01034365.1.p1 GENE.GEMP01034365.1~~GEMP01034365.1.p1  ORF type:complete len:557 (+),score=131.46 GEMP01034365.1:259-1929(+)
MHAYNGTYEQKKRRLMGNNSIMYDGHGDAGSVGPGTSTTLGPEVCTSATNEDATQTLTTISSAIRVVAPDGADPMKGAGPYAVGGSFAPTRGKKQTPGSAAPTGRTGAWGKGTWRVATMARQPQAHAGGSPHVQEQETWQQRWVTPATHGPWQERHPAVTSPRLTNAAHSVLLDEDATLFSSGSQWERTDKSFASSSDRAPEGDKSYPSRWNPRPGVRAIGPAVDTSSHLPGAGARNGSTHNSGSSLHGCDSCPEDKETMPSSAARGLRNPRSSCRSRYFLPTSFFNDDEDAMRGVVGHCGNRDIAELPCNNRQVGAPSAEHELSCMNRQVGAQSAEHELPSMNRQVGAQSATSGEASGSESGEEVYADEPQRQSGSPQWHHSASSVGQVFEDGRVFVKKQAGQYKDHWSGAQLPPLCILFERHLRIKGIHRCCFCIMEGNIGSADGVGFVFDTEIRRKNIQEVRSIFLNSHGQICQRNLSKVTKFSQHLPPFVIGCEIEIIINLNSWVVTFETRSHSQKARGEVKISTRGGGEMKLYESGFFCAVVTQSVALRLS